MPPTNPATRTPPGAALSTMWAMQPRFERDLHAFMERAAALGYSGVEINHSMDAAQAGAILGYRGLPTTSVHAPAPLERHPSKGWNRELNLASTDEAERALSVEYHLRSIALAAQAGASVVAVHLGGVGARLLDGERRLRSMYERRDVMRDEWERTIDATVRERAEKAAPWLASAARSLAEIAEAASRAGVTLAIETRLHYHEIPLPQELATLLAPYPVTVAGYLHDVGHAEVHHRLGVTDRGAWWDLLGDRLVLLHLHDVRGLTDHRAPGNGDVDFAWLAERIRGANPSALRTFEIDQHESDEDVASGLRLLVDAGIVVGE
ncbi:MAG: sugar phosphate isomerase/epimerase [Chloroflexi bacterium]|nr:sugar phosphate isomerase/epimerase [Chloroflexota bacterium]MDA1240286.1 sugar phosphate isomerase/epimerase [Chloroflexota bacterium]MQC47999.1 sugar phosphate isomerase/epimerase [Chloroflexota bacterium]